MSRVDPEPSGSEHLNVAALHAILDGPGLDVEILTPSGGRASLVARIEGSDPSAPSLALLAHTDVVPAEDTGWIHDPFGGDLIDGEVWGRGAVDMLNQTSAMALAVRQLADEDFKPRGSLTFLAVPDEECGGRRGMKPLVEQYPDEVLADFVLSEVGGAVQRNSSGVPVIEAYVAEKGMMTVVITVRGIPGHTSIPWGSSNAIVRCAEVVRRIEAYRPPTGISEEWSMWVAAQEFDQSLTAALLDEAKLWELLPTLDPELARTAHACCHRTVVPAIVTGGEKMGTIPDSVCLKVHVRQLIGEEPEEVLQELRTVLSGIVDEADIISTSVIPGTRSNRDNQLWPVLEAVASARHPGARLLPSLLPAQTDARWLRPTGATVYGFGVLSDRVSRNEYWSRFHGRNERIDLASLELSHQGWIDVCREFLT